MNKFEPTYSEGDLIRNMNTGERYKIIDMEYDRMLCDIVYKVQHYRFKFDIGKIPECVVLRNVENEDYMVNKDG